MQLNNIWRSPWSFLNAKNTKVRQRSFRLTCDKVVYNVEKPIVLIYRDDISSGSMWSNSRVLTNPHRTWVSNLMIFLKCPIDVSRIRLIWPNIPITCDSHRKRNITSYLMTVVNIALKPFYPKTNNKYILDHNISKHKVHIRARENTWEMSLKRRF